MMREAHLGATGAVRARVYGNADELSDHLAGHLCEAIERAAAMRRPFRLGCPTGRSPEGTYRSMGRIAAERKLDLSRLTLVMMDEYVFPRPGGGFAFCSSEAHYSCRRYAHTKMRDVLNAGLPVEKQLTREGIWFPSPDDPAAYDRRIEAAGGVDVFLVASGTRDGHVAFNPPGTPADAPSRVIELAEDTRRDNLGTFPDFKGLDEVPAHGVSVGPRTILTQSKEISLILHGAGKARSAERLNGLSRYDPSWPVSIIHSAADHVTAWLDEAAAAGLH